MKSAENGKRVGGAKGSCIRRAALGLLVLSTLLMTGAARAQSAPPKRAADDAGVDVPGERLPETPSQERKFYGHQLMLADGIADSVLFTGGVLGAFCSFSGMDLSGNGGGSSDNSVGCTAATVHTVGALGTYLLAPPLIHASHGRPGAAFGSAGMRVGVLTASAALENAGEGGGLVLIGGVVAVRVIDWFLLSREKPATTQTTSLTARLRPTFAVGERNAEIGLSGTF